MGFNFSIAYIKLLESHYKLNTDYKFEENKKISLSGSIRLQYIKENNIVRVILSVSSENIEQPFTYNVAFEGGFKFQKMPSKKILEKIVNINCASIIFPYVRETVADLTRRSVIPPFHIAPINFVASYNEKLRLSASQKNIRKS